MAKQEKSQYKKAATLELNQQYRAPNVLLSASECYFNKQPESLIKKCSELKNIYNKMYDFDSMTKKLFNAATIAILEQKVPVYFTNDCNTNILKNLALQNPEGKSIGLCNTRGFVLNNIQGTKIVFNTMSNIKGLQSGLDDLYEKISHEFGHLVLRIVLNNNSLPFKDTQEKISFKNQAKEILRNIFKDHKEKPADFTFEEGREIICSKFPAYKQNMYEQRINNKNNIAVYGTYLNKFVELNTIYGAFCDYKTFTGISIELAVRHFEQISNGLESDIGTNHQNLIYLQPLVEYTKEYLYPKFDEYINSKCSQSTTYSCELKGDDLYITMLPQLHGEL